MLRLCPCGCYALGERNAAWIMTLSSSGMCRNALFILFRKCERQLLHPIYASNNDPTLAQLSKRILYRVMTDGMLLRCFFYGERFFRIVRIQPVEYILLTGCHNVKTCLLINMLANRIRLTVNAEKAIIGGHFQVLTAC